MSYRINFDSAEPLLGDEKRRHPPESSYHTSALMQYDGPSPHSQVVQLLLRMQFNRLTYVERGINLRS